MSGTGRSAPNSPYMSENLFTSREWGFLWPISIYIGVLWFFLRTMSIQALQAIIHDIMYWCVFYIDTILLIVVLLILWKVFWEMS